VRAVVQRVSRASVSVDGDVVGRIDHGLAVLVGVAAGDGQADVEYIASKVRDMRVFGDKAGRLHRSVVDVGGAVLLVSQFTLMGDLRRGRRPAFDAAAPPDEARAAYQALGERLRAGGVSVETGRFQAMMRVDLVNEGPVTVLLDSRRAF
jgi:D-tyrosyl-tRNA(Tyr) deacylase